MRIKHLAMNEKRETLLIDKGQRKMVLIGNGWLLVELLPLFVDFKQD